MVIKSFKESHPIVLFSYFIAMIVLSIIQRNYFFIVLIAVSAILVDYFYNKDSFLKDLRYFIILILLVTITNPLFVMEGKDILYQNSFITITQQALVYGLVFGMLLGSMLLWFKVMKACIRDSHIVYLFGSVLPTLGLIISMSFNIINKLKIQYHKIKEANYHLPAKNKFIYYRNIVVILVTYAFESSLDMMNSMIARGYGKNKRTSFHLYSFKKDDFLKILIIIGLSAICFWGYFGYYQNFYYYPIIQSHQFRLIDILFFVTYFVLAIFPIWLGGKKNV